MLISMATLTIVPIHTQMRRTLMLKKLVAGLTAGAFLAGVSLAASAETLDFYKADYEAAKKTYEQQCVNNTAPNADYCAESLKSLDKKRARYEAAKAEADKKAAEDKAKQENPTANEADAIWAALAEGKGADAIPDKVESTTSAPSPEVKKAAELDAAAAKADADHAMYCAVNPETNRFADEEKCLKAKADRKAASEAIVAFGKQVHEGAKPADKPAEKVEKKDADKAQSAKKAADKKAAAKKAGLAKTGATAGVVFGFAALFAAAGATALRARKH